MMNWQDKRVLVTGGAGFIGSNLADYLLQRGCTVTVYDNLARKGVEKNLAWLEERYATPLRVILGDVRDYAALLDAAQGQDVIFHMASQVAVTSSITNPRQDFEVNALGTFNLLEAARRLESDPIVVYASTNKVYGEMTDVGIVEQTGGYAYAGLPQGVPESRPLDFHSPYGCSKGAGDQYTIDYARIYGLRTIVFRQSCIYGQRQFGNEDQGWVAHFLISAIRERPITIYGDGKQVRDILYVDDLIRAYELAIEQIDVTRGRAYNVGGGPKNAISIWADFSRVAADLLERDLPVDYGPWRPGDQKVYVSDIRKAERDFGWAPRISAAEGIARLFNWITSNPALFEERLADAESVAAQPMADLMPVVGGARRP